MNKRHQPYFQLYSEIEIDDLGNLHLVYYNYGSSLEFLNIRYGKMDLDGMLLEESVPLGVTTEEAEPCDCCAPDLEVIGNGNVYIAYRNNIGNIRDHYITRKMVGESEFSEPVPIAVLNDIIGFCPSSSPSIYIDDNSMAASSAVEVNNSQCKRMLQIFSERAIKGEHFKDSSESQVTKFIDKRIKENSDWYLAPDDAVYYGFADGILGYDGVETLEKIRVGRKIK